MDIHRITMEIMGNQHLIKGNESSNVLNCVDAEEYSFYSERIIELTEELLKRDLYVESRIWKDVSTSFNHYVDNCIKYFKMTDTTDLLQSEYNELYIVKTEEEKEKEAMDQLELLGLDNISYENANKSIMRNVKCDMTNFIKRTKSQKPSFYFPKQKEINLQCESLKNKSIHGIINIPLVVNESEQCELTGENTYVVIKDLNNIVNEFDEIISSSSPPYVGLLGDALEYEKGDHISCEDYGTTKMEVGKTEDATHIRSHEEITTHINDTIIPRQVVEEIVMGLVHNNMLQTLQEHELDVLQEKEIKSISEEIIPEPVVCDKSLENIKELPITQKSGKKKNKGKGKKKNIEENISSSLHINI